jgi:hypothetical protein
MDALDVARLMHRLFSAFDAAVTCAGLFKMDTVGDAYVAAGFLPLAQPWPGPCDDGHAAAMLAGQACDRVLLAARDMIAAVAACREETGRDVHCRIGVSAGEVLAGVLGRLQPRFHIFGAGLTAAERHEKAGQIDAVHASPSFMAALTLATGSQVDGVNEDCSDCSQPRPDMSVLKERSAGSSGRWDVRQSDVVDLPSCVCNSNTFAFPGPCASLLMAGGLADAEQVSNNRLAGSSGNSEVRQSDEVDLPPNSCNTFAVPGQCSASLPKAGGLVAAEPASALTTFSTCSSPSDESRLPTANRIVSGSICDAKVSFLGAAASGQHRSFILLPQPDPSHNSQHWAEQGWRFYHANALASGVPSADMCYQAGFATLLHLIDQQRSMLPGTDTARGEGIHADQQIGTSSENNARSSACSTFNQMVGSGASGSPMPGLDLEARLFAV